MNKKTAFEQAFIMEKFDCGSIKDFELADSFFECGTCGNHVCKTKAELWGRVCPNCFGRLYRIS